MSKCLYCQTELPEGYGMVCSSCEKDLLNHSGDFKKPIYTKKRKPVFKRCSNCTHCSVDLRAVQFGVFIDKCFLHKHHILHPFWKGWRCKDWRRR